MFKYKYLVLFSFLFILFCIDNTYAYFNNNLPLLQKIIYIDPGHGGVDPGAVYKDIKESDINLNFSLSIGEKLESLGAIVFYTRKGDYDLAITKNGRKKSDLSNRIKIINESDCDLYLSIHVNSETSGNWYGAQVFYTNKNVNNKLLASKMQEVLEKNKISKRKISIIEDTYMYDRIKNAGILLEIGFISNYSDRNKMQNKDYIEKFSELVTSAVIKYLENI